MCQGRKTKIWTEENLQFLRDNYDRLSVKDIADALGITSSCVYQKAAELCLCKSKTHWKITPKVREEIIRMYPTNSYKSIADKLHISAKSVYRLIQHLVAENKIEKRTRKSTGMIISSRRLQLLKNERSHEVFGLPPKSKVKTHPSPRKSIIRHLLRKSGKYEVDFGSNEIFVLNMDSRDTCLEERALSFGMEFFRPVGEEGEQTVFEKFM